MEEKQEALTTMTVQSNFGGVLERTDSEQNIKLLTLQSQASNHNNSKDYQLAK